MCNLGGVCSPCWLRVASVGEGSSSLVRTALVDRDVLLVTALDVGFCSSDHVAAPVRRYQGLKQLNQRALFEDMYSQKFKLIIKIFHSRTVINFVADFLCLQLVPNNLHIK